jgi:O-antigen/teichoic acid export membrane protein
LPLLMQKKFLSNLVFLVVLNLLVKPFWILGIDRGVQNAVGAETYGSYFALFNLALILNIVNDLGITSFNTRHISQHGHMLGKYFTRMVALRVLLAIGYGLLCLAVGLSLGYDRAQLTMLGLLSINQFLMSSVMFLRSNVAGMQLFSIDSLLSIMDRGLLIAGCSLLLWGGLDIGPFQIDWFIWMQTAALSLTMLVALAVVLRNGGEFHVQWGGKVFWAILKKSLPFALLILLMGIYGRIDAVMLERLLPDGDLQSGIYAQAFRMLDAANMMAYLFAALLLPMFSRMLKTGEDVRPLALLGFKLLITPAVSLAIAALFHGPAIMQLLYGSHVKESGEVLSILLLSFVPMAGTYVFGTLLTAHGSMKTLNLIAVAGVVTNVSVNLLLIPEWGIFGAALTCLLTQTMTFGLQCILAIRTFEFKVSAKELAMAGAVLMAVVATGFLTEGLPWSAATAVLVVAGAVGTLTLTWSDLGMLLRKPQDHLGRQP